MTTNRLIAKPLGHLVGLMSIVSGLFFAISFGQTGFSCIGVSVPDEECLALMSLYDTMQGDQWSSATNWGISAQVGDWYGVTTATKEGQEYVIGLDLSSNALIGQVPSGLGDLSMLETLDLSSNTITGLPASIGTLSSLQLLDVSATLLTSLPSTISDLTALSTLDISTTPIQTLPDMTGMSQLDQLLCKHSSMTSLPASLMELPDLNHVDCRYSEVASVGGMTSQINSLLLTDNNLVAFGPINLPQIQLLILDENPLSTIKIDSVAGSLLRIDLGETAMSTLEDLIPMIPAVEYLYADQTLLTEVSDLSGLGSLQEFRVHGNMIAALPPGLETLDTLRVFYGYDNQMTGRLPDAYAGLTNITHWYINDNMLDRALDHTALLSPVLQTRSSELGYNYYDAYQGDITAPEMTLMTPPIFFTTGTVVSLDFDLHENSYLLDQQGDGIVMTRGGGGECSSLGDLIWESNGIQTVTLDSLETGIYEHCTVTATDHAGNTSSPVSIGSFVVGTELQDLCTHPDLTVTADECIALIELYAQAGGSNWYENSGWFGSPDVDMRHGVDADGGHVVGLYLHKTAPGDGHGSVATRDGNNLGGGFPEAVLDLPYLQHLNLSRNWLGGAIPEGWEGFTQLQTVVINEATLVGELPSSLGSLSSLVVLQMRQNGFDQAIPEMFGSMNQLQVLDLGHNALSGEFPESVGDIMSLRVLDLSSNTLGGELLTTLGDLSTLEVIRLDDNRFTGQIPTSWQDLKTKQFTIAENTLDRTVDRRPIMTPAINAWYQSHTIKTSADQDDITPPVLTSLPRSGHWIQNEPFLYSFEITEESFAIDQYGEGMEVIFSGSDLCDSLTGSSIVSTTGIVTSTIYPSQLGRYEGCELAVVDHGGNTSNFITTPEFGVATGNEAICYHPSAHTSREVCLELVRFYEETGGDQTWTDTTGWGTSPVLQSWYGLDGTVADATITSISLADNGLMGDLSLDLVLLEDLRVLNVNNNTLDGMLLATSGSHGLTHLMASGVQLSGSIADALSDFDQLTVLDLTQTMVTDTIASLIQDKMSLEEVFLSDNEIGGSLGSWIGSLSVLTTIDISNNMITGRLPGELMTLSALESVDLHANQFDRDPNHEAITPSGWGGFVISLVEHDGSGQSDLTPPALLGVDHSQLVSSSFDVVVDLQEGSYAVSSGGTGMLTSLTGPYPCALALISPVDRSDGTGAILLTPMVAGVYEGCTLGVTDHGDNIGTIAMQSFEYDFACGNGQIDTGEACDEGKTCDDGRDCTSNPSLCLSECRVRFVDGCNEFCQESYCGDGYTDLLGLDSTLGTIDDEQCDGGRYCSDTGEDCTSDASICPTTCSNQVTAGCSASCELLTCGDGYVDIVGGDGEYDTGDEEQCDDANMTNGDGCNTNCQREYCGDGYVDSDGWTSGTLTHDPESCDAGPNNGIAGGSCTVGCELVGTSCFGCWEGCDGTGSGDHVTFLVFDISGSMNGHNRKENAQDAHHRFIDLLPDSFLDAQGNIVSGSIAGLATFNNGGEVIVDPTHIDQALHDEIDGISAGGTTNYATVLELVDDMIDTYPGDVIPHVVLLSDGEPTQPGGKKNAKDAAKDAASDLKASGVEIFTVGLQQSNKGMDLLEDLASGPEYVYEDPDNNRLTQIYEEIYGSIHCDCFDQQVCPECGDEVVELGEVCDGGRQCDDGTVCTDDLSLCPDECVPRFTIDCTPWCQRTFCGDGEVQAPNASEGIMETCDDGNVAEGDGCSSLCQAETCGDSIVDVNGPDNRYGTLDDEQCDDGNQNDDANRCMSTCKRNPVFMGDAGVCGVVDPVYTLASGGSGLSGGSVGLCQAGSMVGFAYHASIDAWTRTCEGIQGAASASCELSEYFCGDGIVDTGDSEQCDDGNTLNGDGCSVSCQLETIVGAPLGLGGSCHELNYPLIVQENEIMPLTWDLWLSAGVDSDATDCSELTPGTFIPGGSLTCTIQVGDQVSFQIPCLGYAGADSVLFVDVEHDYSRTPGKGGAMIQGLPPKRYTVTLSDVSYTQCGLNRENQLIQQSEIQSGLVCTIPLGVVRGYAVEKGSTLSTINQTAIAFTDDEDNSLISSEAYESIQSLQVSNAAGSIVKTFTETFLDTYRWSSLIDLRPYGSNQSVKKSLTNNIYFFKGDVNKKSIRIGDQFLIDADTPFTLLVEDADLIIEGSLEGNGLYIVSNGSIRFEPTNCDMQDRVEGIFVTDQGFDTLNTVNTSTAATQWCKGGNLVIKGLFIGEGINESFVQKRRSHLNLWGLETSVNQADGTAQEFDALMIKNQALKLLEGPSVRIDTTPLYRADLPPGMRELFDVVEVWR